MAADALGGRRVPLTHRAAPARRYLRKFVFSGDLFDSVADGTRGVYQKHLAYFGRWCQGRGIRQSLVETDHIKVYVMEMREGRGLSVSWLGCAVAADAKGGHLSWYQRFGPTRTGSPEWNCPQRSPHRKCRGRRPWLDTKGPHRGQRLAASAETVSARALSKYEQR